MYEIEDRRTDVVLPAMRGDWITVERLLSEMDFDDVEVVAEVLQRLANRANRVYYRKLAEAYDKGD